MNITNIALKTEIMALDGGRKSGKHFQIIQIAKAKAHLMHAVRAVLDLELKA